MSDTPVDPFAGGSGRSPTYNVGGVPPYGWTGTPADNQKWQPTTTGNEVALYERLDWDKIPQSMLLNQYENPPFIGIGSTGGRMPSWLNGSRILRGYMRRLETVGISRAVSDEDKASNTRLFFMFNPPEVARNYLSFADTENIRTMDLNDAINAGLPAFTTITVTLELLFDRAEEVARYPNHPGCLIDLAVFDLLVGNRPFTPSVIDTIRQNVLGAFDTANPEVGAPSAADSFQSLAIDTSMPLAFIMSPNLMFQGTIQSAGALFQKFSHRMTPTRMTLSLSLLVTYTGKKLDASRAAPGTVGAFAGKRNQVATVDPALKAESDAKANQLNADGRWMAVDWGEAWCQDIPDHKKLVPYTMSARCDNWSNDDYVNRDPPHQPGHFDCSSFVWRCYHVIGWSEALHLTASCGDITDGFYKAASEHTDVWDLLDIRGVFMGNDANATMARNFNYWTVPDSERDVPDRHGPERGDCLIKGSGRYGSGAGAAGHIAMIHSFVATDPDPLKWRWKLIESFSSKPEYGGPYVRIREFTTAKLLTHPYHWLVRPGPINTSPGVGKGSGGGGGGSW